MEVFSSGVLKVLPHYPQQAHMGLFITDLVHVSTALIHFGKLHHWKTVCTSICSFFLLQYRDKSWHYPDLHFPVVADWWDFLGKFSVGSPLLSQVRLMFLHMPLCKKCLSQVITFLTAKKLFEAAIVFEYNLTNLSLWCSSISKKKWLNKCNSKLL